MTTLVSESQNTQLPSAFRAYANYRPDPMPAGPILRLCNVKYSPNLGDGLLSECLEDALIGLGAAASSTSIDLAARTRFSSGSHNRSMQMRMLETLPVGVRKHAIRLPLAFAARKRWAPHYRSGLSHAQALVIGGGNLLADLDLNFPTKIALAVHEAHRLGLPVYIYGCGASANWSAAGLKLLHGALATGAIRKVFLRDTRSCQIWNTQLRIADAPVATRVRDPGLLAASRYDISPLSRRPAGLHPLVGINITSPLALKYHSRNAPGRTALDQWYLQLACNLVQSGYELVIFTNGSPEDRAYADSLKPRLQAIRGQSAIRFPDCNTPSALTALIASLHGLVAFRMHAVIAAYACSVPFLALKWDPKLDSFVQSVDLTQWLCDPANISPDEAVSQLASAMATGIDNLERDRVTQEAHADVRTLYDAIVSEQA